MANSNYNTYICGWIEKIQSNIQKFKDSEDFTDADKIEFITHQYHLLMLINKALIGQVLFVGAKPIGDQL